jgi:hypothetical protein
MMKYIWNILIGIDQLANAILLGDPGETISSRMGKHLVNKNCKVCKFICKLLNLINPNHCMNSIENDEGDDAIIE